MSAFTNMRFQNLITSRRLALTVVCISAILATAPTRAAVTITELVDTPTNLSFNFSAPSFEIPNFLNSTLGSLTNWDLGLETHAFGTAGFGILLEMQHFGGGPVVTLGTLSPLTPLGTALVDFETVAHGSNFDT